MTIKRIRILAGSFLLFTFISANAQHRAEDQNPVRSHKIAGIAMPGEWSFCVLALAVMPVHKNEMNGFRGNSVGSKLSGQYYFGNMGLGLTAGVLPGSISSTALNSFLAERKFLQTQVSRSDPFNSFFLFGPTARFGQRVLINTEVQAGFALNNPGAISITQPGAQRALYQFGAGEKNLFPAFSGSMGLAYPITATTRFVVHGSYLQTKSTLLLSDPQRGVDVATVQQRNVRIMSIGVGVTKNFKSTEVYRAVRSRNRSMVESARYHAINTKGTAATNGRMNNTESCGTVIQRTVLADGSVEERTFACPADAAEYENLRTVKVPKQTQGTTFGEKVNAGLHASNGVAATPVVDTIDAAGRKGWDGTVKGGSVVADAPAEKGIQENGIKKNAAENTSTEAARKGWDGTVKGGSVVAEAPSSKGINEAGIKTNATESTSDVAVRKGWDGTVKGGSVVADVSAGKGIQENGIKKNAAENKSTEAARKGWDGTVKGGSAVAEVPGSKGINEAGIEKKATESTSDAAVRKGLDGTVKGGSVVVDAPAGKGIQENGIKKNTTENTSDAAERKGWDGTVKGGSKAQVHNPSRSDKSSVSIDSSIAIQKDFLQALDELDVLLAADQHASSEKLQQVKANSRQLRALLGKESIGSAMPDVEAVFKKLVSSITSLGEAYQSISNVLKTKHETAKNSIGNIR